MMFNHLPSPGMNPPSTSLTGSPTPPQRSCPYFEWHFDDLLLPQWLVSCPYFLPAVGKKCLATTPLSLKRQKGLANLFTKETKSDSLQPKKIIQLPIEIYICDKLETLWTHRSSDSFEKMVRFCQKKKTCFIRYWTDDLPCIEQNRASSTNDLRPNFNC